MKSVQSKTDDLVVMHRRRRTRVAALKLPAAVTTVGTRENQKQQNQERG